MKNLVTSEGEIGYILEKYEGKNRGVLTQSFLIGDAYKTLYENPVMALDSLFSTEEGSIIIPKNLIKQCLIYAVKDNGYIHIKEAKRALRKFYQNKNFEYRAMKFDFSRNGWKCRTIKNEKRYLSIIKIIKGRRFVWLTNKETKKEVYFSNGPNRPFVKCFGKSD